MPNPALGITTPRRMAGPSCAPMGSSQQSEGAPPNWWEVGPRVWPRYRALRSKIYRPTGSTVTNASGTYSGTYIGAVLLQDGRVFCVPYGATAARIYDPRTDTLQTAGPSITTHIGGVLLPDGRVFCIPYTNTTATIYDPVTDTKTTITTSNNNNYGGCLTGNGDVVMAPYRSTNDVQIYSSSSNTCYTISGVSSVNAGYGGAALLPDGRVFLVPQAATAPRIVDVVNKTVTTPSWSGSGGFVGGIPLKNGDIFCVPAYGRTTALIYEPLTNTYRTPSGTYPAPGETSSGRLLPDGRVFIAPRGATSAYVYDPDTDTVSTLPGFTSTYYQGVVLLGDGRVFMAPLSTSTASIWNGGYSVNLTPARVLSAYDNKL